MSRPDRLVNLIGYNAVPGDDINVIPSVAPSPELGKGSVELGFPPITREPIVSGGEPALMQDMNGFLNLLSSFSFFYQAGGKFIWTVDEPEYLVGNEILGSNSLIYICVQINGSDSITQDPTLDISQTYWAPGGNQIATLAEVLAGLNAVKIVTPLTLEEKISNIIIDGGIVADYQDFFDYLVLAYSIGSDGEIYQALIANGPNNLPVVDPVGDTTGTWKKRDSGFYNAYLKYSDVKTTGTDGGSSLATTTQVRTFNTEDADTANIGSLSANQITLPAGTYIMKASCTCLISGRHRAHLYDTTGPFVLVLGASNYTAAGTTVGNMALVSGRFTIGVESVLELRHYTEIAKATNGLGIDTGDGLDNIYSTIEFWRES